MNKKGSMELSVNSIVILVIAIVMLGLILGFVRSKFGDLDKKLVSDEPEAQAATPSNKLTISRETIAVSGGEEVILKAQVYAVRDIDETMVPRISCSGLDVTNQVQNKSVSQGEVAQYTFNTKIPGSASKGKYLCALKMDWPASEDGTIKAVYLNKDLVIEVK